MGTPIRNVRLFKPSVGEEELANVREVFDRAWLGLGPMLERFENEWCAYIGMPHSVGVNSCTAALHLALACRRFPRGKKVLVPAITFVSSALCILYSGLTPVFVDVDPVSLSVDLERADGLVDKDCVAIIAVHMGGHPVAMDKLVPWARERNLLVIEDCANCAGGVYAGRKLGTWGDVGCFSFEEKKNMTTGDGGMICLQDAELATELRAWRWVGIDRDTWKRAQLSQGDSAAVQERHWYYEVGIPGLKYNMNDVAAAIGLAQLRKLDSMNARKASLISRYLTGLAGLSLYNPLFPYALDGSAYWLFGVRVDPSLRDRLGSYLRSHGIGTGVHFMPLPLHPLFRGSLGCYDTALMVWQELLTLPLHADLTHEEVDYVIEHLTDFARKVS